MLLRINDRDFNPDDITIIEPHRLYFDDGQFTIRFNHGYTMDITAEQRDWIFATTNHMEGLRCDLDAQFTMSLIDALTWKQPTQQESTDAAS
jgi:hypothetical protein